MSTNFLTLFFKGFVRCPLSWSLIAASPLMFVTSLAVAIEKQWAMQSDVTAWLTVIFMSFWLAVTVGAFATFGSCKLRYPKKAS
jgi:hypothetical protein